MKSKPKIPLFCKTCGGIFLVQPYRTFTAKYCSFRCGNIAKGKVGRLSQIARRGTGKKHPYVKENGRHQHRVVAERSLGRPLRTGEVVHHKDGNGHNNDPSNLEVTTQSSHINIHRSKMMEVRKRKAGY